MTAAIRKTGWWELIVALTGVLALLLLAPPVQAVPRTWVGPTGSDNLWSTSTNWSPAGQPVGGDGVNLTQSDVTNRIVMYDDTATAPVTDLSFLFIDATGSGTITLQQTANTLSAEKEGIGLAGTGAYQQSGGTNTVRDELTIGEGATGSGTYDLSSGSLSADFEDIGKFGLGTFTQSGGTNTLDVDLNLGVMPTGSGTYDLIGGTLLVTNEEVVGRKGCGAFIQSGGTHTVTSIWSEGGLQLGLYPGSSGTYNLSSGSLRATFEGIGVSGTGIFTQSGGTHTVGVSLILGNESTGSGTYDLSGGILSVGDYEFIGDHGTGSFTQSGGTHTVNGNLRLACGTYKLQDGQLSAGTIDLRTNGLFNQTGGSWQSTFNQVGGTVTGTLEVLPSSTFNFNSGTFAGDLVNQGTTHSNTDFTVGNGMTFSQVSGTSRASANLYVGDALGDGTVAHTGGSTSITGGLFLGHHATSTGSYTLSGDGSLSAADEIIGVSGTGVFTQSGGINNVFNKLLIGANGTYNQNGGTLNADTIEILPGGEFFRTGSDFSIGALNNAGTVYLGGSGLTEITGKTENQAGGLIHGDGIPANFGDDVINYGTFKVTNSTVTFGGAYMDYGTFISDGASMAAHNLVIGGDCLFTGGNLSAENLQVNSGATFRGSGMLSARFTNRGMLRPGTSVGPLDIVGSFTQDPSGTLEIEIESPTSFDQINVTGTASLAGTLAPVFVGRYKPAGNLVFPFLTATGGVSGTFDYLNSPIVKCSLRYNPTSVELLFSRNYTDPSLGLCPNQWQVGNMLNSVAATATGDLANVLNVIDFLPTASAVREAYKQISADKASTLPDLGLATAVLQQRSLAQRITDLRFGGRAMNLARGFPGSFNLFGSRGGGLMLAYNGASLVGMIPAQKETASENRWGVFLDPAVILGNRGSTVSQTGYDYTLAGFTLGVDYRVRPDFLVGLATGYSHTYAKFRGSGGSVTNHTWPLTAYAAYLPENGYAFASLGYALNLFDLERQIIFGGLARRAQSSTTGHQFNAYGEAGYDFKMKPVVITPAVSLAYTHIAVNGFTEKNAGALNLKVDAQSADSLQTGVGVKVAAPFKAGSVKVVPQAYAFYQHEFSNNSRGLDARLSQGSSTMAFTTDEPQRDFAVVGGNVTMFINKKLSAMVNYNAEVGRGNSTVHSISAGLRWEF